MWEPPVVRAVPPFAPHPWYGWHPAPGRSGRQATPEYDHAYAHTAQGLRSDRLHLETTAPGKEARVLLLGDSFVWGLGVEDDETIPAILATTMPGVEMVNAGAAGYGQREELAVLDRLGAALEPDLVVVAFFWNDVADNHNRDSPAYDFDESGRVRRADPPGGRLPPPLAVLPRVEAEPRSPWRTWYLGRLIKTATRKVRHRLWDARHTFPATPDERKAGWKVTRRYLELLAARAREIGSRLLVVSIPDYTLVDPSKWTRHTRPIHYETGDLFAGACRELGVDGIDLTSGLRDAAKKSDEPLYFALDRHLTPAGARAVAGLLEGELRERLPDGAR